MKNKIADILGLSSSVICLIHCLLPVFLVSGMLGLSHWLHNPIVEIVLIGVAIFSVSQIWKSIRGSFLMWFFIFGLLLLSLGIFFHGFQWGSILMIGGGILLSSSHLYHLFLFKRA